MRFPYWPAAFLFAAAPAVAAETQVLGKVVDDNQLAVAGALVSIQGQAAVSDHAGAFRLVLDSPGDYRISARREGYFQLRDRPVRLAAGDNFLTLILNHQRGVVDSIEVSYSPPAVNPEETAATRQVVSTELLGVPYPSTNNLLNALPMMPGIVQDSTGQIHLNGASADQAFWTLDGFNITDPLTGRLTTRLSIDGVQAVEVASSRYSAETGKGSAGAVQIRTAMGDDRWRPAATNFIPSVENHKGLALTDWTPRVTFSGPLRRGRVWLSDSADASYDKNVVEELPAGADRNVTWRMSNLVRLQVNLTPSHIFTASWLANYIDAARNGLGLLDPLETTVDRRSRQDFLALKDQLYLGRGALVEAGWARTRGRADEVPQGRELYVFTPDGRQGNFFLEAHRRSGRDQWLANIFFPSFQRAGNHQLKAGFDFDRVTYSQRADRHGYEFYRANGTRTRRVDFAGPAELHRTNSEAAAYLQDRWKPLPALLIEAGTRLDWDRIVGRTVLSPRLSFSLAVPGLENTKIAGGVGLFHDASNLRVLSRHLDQYALARYYGPDGRTLQYGPAASVFLPQDGSLRVPVYRNWSFGAEQLLPRGAHLRFEYLRKRGRDGFTFINSLSPASPPAPDLLAAYGAAQFDGLYRLRNARRDVYDSVEVTVRKTFRRQSEVLASYTRSLAYSNAVMDVQVDDPILYENNQGRVPWDTPNRFVGWGIVSLTENNSLAWLAQARTGFPFSVVDDDGRLVGKVTERRYPAHISVNLHWERKFRFWRYRWAWRGGFNNLTNRLNATGVNNNASSPRFLHFSGGQHRAFVMRIRWLGRR